MIVFTDAFAVTPHDTNPLARQTSGLYIGTAGTVSVVMGNKNNTDTLVTFKAAAGVTLPIRVKQVKATGTTATDIVALV